MSKAFLLLGRTGDLINCLPILHAESQSTGAPVNLVCCKQYAPLFGGTSYVNCIPFDGQDSELRRAYDEAKKQFDEVVSLQVIGNTQDVNDLTYGPAGFDKAQTDSFQKEPFWLSKRKDLWAQQARPLFDGRSKARERKLIEQHPLRDKRLNIFVAADGRSSPFAYKTLLMELLRGRFENSSPNRKIEVIDLSEYKADRFYDFIGLLEQAYCLVCIDSAFLHLAHALRDLPVCALTNDSPSLWFGSAWRANHISHIRYSDFPTRAIEMLCAIESIKAPASFFLRDNFVTNQRLIHVYSAYEVSEESKERHMKAIGTWGTTYTQDCWINCIIEPGACGRDSKNHNTVKDETGRYPFLKDVIRLAGYRARDHDVIVLTRCDTCFAPNLTEQLLNGPLPAYSHRHYRENGNDTWHPMVDLFAFTKHWWNQHREELPDYFLAPDQFWNRTMLDRFIKLGAREILEGVYRAPSNARIEGGTRKQWNENLHSEYQTKNGEIAFFKPVVEQLPSAIVNPQALPAYAYNPSIIRYQNRLLCVYRYHDQRDFSTALGIAEIDEKGTVYGRKQLQIPHMGGSEEDARFFMRGQTLCLCYVDSTYPAMPPRAVVKYGRLVEDTVWTLQEIHQPEYGNNDIGHCQKNWVMWELNGELFCQYSTSPKTVILKLNGARADVVAEDDGPRWSYGQIRGGTTPLPYKDKLLRFFHSAVDSELPPDFRRYFVGAMLIEPEPPFKPIAVSKRPILFGSEKDTMTDTHRSACIHFKAKVVFPLGAIPHADGFLLSCGINDSQCALVYIKPENLNL